MSDNKKHKGRIVAISGGSQGIGQAIVLRLAREGARVAVLDTTDTSETIALGEKDGDAIRGFHCDVSQWDQVQQTAKSVRSVIGDPGIVIHCAAYQFMKPFDELQPADWYTTQAVNLNGGFHLVKAFLPAMRAANWGRIVMVASSSFFAPPSGMTHYIASKGALLGLVRGLAAEVGDHGITVNALAPGLTRTKNSTEKVPQAHFDLVRSRQAVKRNGEPEDQAAAISFMVSDDAAFMSGQTILVDGGEGHV